ncbi:hypothetical protein ACU6U9_02875 [Pseudomonas sp. HK3]
MKSVTMESCQGWQPKDLAHMNAVSAMGMLQVTIDALGAPETEYVSTTLRLIYNLLNGALPSLDPTFKPLESAMVLVPAQYCSEVL